jgi:2',3'-cyclic-nucleotide 2'-phosphodiesterase (5'-nucleotidase family)
MNEISSEQKGGYAEIAYFIKQQRALNTPFFFLFGGGSIGPSKLASFDRGSHTIDLLNSIEPDVMAITKRDFSFFEDELSLRSYEAAFPFVTTNVIDKETNRPLNGLLPSVITQQGNYKIGIVSTMAKSAIEEYNLKRIIINDERTSVKSEVKKLRAKNVDLIILLHSSRENDVVSLLDDGTVDLVLQKNLNTKVIKDQQANIENPRYIVVNNIDEFAFINLSGVKSKKLTINTTFRSYRPLDKDVETQRKVDQYKARLSNLLDEVIGTVQAPMNTQRIVVRQQESAFANLITDALRDYTHADIAVLNGGSIRGESIYSIGQSISRRHVISELPYRSHILLLNISGKQIQQAIEHGLSGIENGLGRFLHVSGLSVVYDTSLPHHHRVISIKHNNEILILDKMYSVAMSDYLASGGDSHTTWKNAERLEYSRQKHMLISDIVINYIRQKGNVEQKVEYRLIDKNKGVL